MDSTGTRLGILAVALALTLSACSGPETAPADLRAPASRGTPPATAGTLASEGGAGLGLSPGSPH
ncbi:MAG TPA: hypothetical protein VM575_20040 [Nocardioides sp.]|nr:hypothetical protein [Nocardioides sp.]